MSMRYSIIYVLYSSKIVRLRWQITKKIQHTLKHSKTSNISRILEGNKIVDRTDVVACRPCSNYIFILDLTPGFNRLGQDNCKMRQEPSTVKSLILDAP